MSIKQQLTGTGVALVTPFTVNESIDFDALGRVIDFVIDNKVEYVVSLGTTGETPTLDKSEKLDIFNYTVDKVASRVPVVVGIGGNSTKEVVSNLQAFPLDKAAAVLSVSPYYNKPSQEGIFEHYKVVAAASAKPIILYNVPGRTGRNMEASTTIKLAHEVSNIIGIKEASNNIAQCIQILKERPADFLVVSGDDDLVLPELACGIDGVISVAANCFPKEFSEMVRLGLKNDFKSAREINNKLLEVYHLLFVENNPAGVKAFLSELGLIQNKFRLPVVPVSNATQQKIQAYLKK